MGKRELELYIHIPFCVQKCAYCDFLSAPADAETRSGYVEALIREIRAAKSKYSGYRVSTVFLGGGTPSILEGDETARIFHALFQNFDIAADAEVTMEANPGTVTEEKAEIWKTSGVNRLSIGLQSVNDRELRMLGRIHTFGEFLHTWETVHRAGFENVNIDLISAIPGQTAGSWEKTLRTAAELEPEHLSAYSLIVEEGTPFYDWYGGQEQTDSIAAAGIRRGMMPPLPDEDEEREIYQLTKRILEEYGYHRYEISNYAKDGYECRHNLGYWERKEYLGLGLGASSLIRECRFRNTADMEKYLKILADPAKYPGKYAGAEVENMLAEEYETLTRSDRMEEFMFLGLRKTAGIREADFRNIFGEDIRQVYGKQIGKLIGQELLAGSDGRLYLTERGIDISNYVFSEFML
ncbi:MAG TPA: radical SAM family heme chaperone HemW [Candidatus Mediterraneibacter excrementavium]|nr:radical SAM family heme chaperone HemW [Candidatus Mediterraneibacter excrementavium]